MSSRRVHPEFFHGFFGNPEDVSGHDRTNTLLNCNAFAVTEMSPVSVIWTRFGDIKPSAETRLENIHVCSTNSVWLATSIQCPQDVLRTCLFKSFKGFFASPEDVSMSHDQTNTLLNCNAFGMTETSPVHVRWTRFHHVLVTLNGPLGYITLMIFFSNSYILIICTCSVIYNRYPSTFRALLGHYLFCMDNLWVNSWLMSRKVMRVINCLFFHKVWTTKVYCL